MEDQSNMVDEWSVARTRLQPSVVNFYVWNVLYLYSVPILGGSHDTDSGGWSGSHSRHSGGTDVLDGRGRKVSSSLDLYVFDAPLLYPSNMCFAFPFIRLPQTLHG